MKTKILGLAFAFLTFFTVSSTLVATQTANKVDAQSQNVLCTIFPFLQNSTYFEALCNPTDEAAEGTVSTVRSLIQLGLSLVFVGIIIIAIYVIIRAAIKYIRSEGDDSKVEEASKSIKRVFLGIAALFVGIIGIVIILAFFNSTDALNVQDPTTDEESPINNLLGL